MSIIYLFLTNVLVSWNPNIENDLAGYKVYFGEQSGQYTKTTDVGNKIYHIWENLDSGKPYYFAISAYDYSGNESDFSNEVSIIIDPSINDTLGSISNVYTFPNPFIEETTVHYIIHRDQLMSMNIYNSNQQHVRTLINTEVVFQGEYLKIWNRRDKYNNRVPRGIYFLKVSSNSTMIIFKMAVR